MAETTLALKITATDITQAAFNSVKAGLSGINKATQAISDSMGNLGRLMAAGAAFTGFEAFINKADEAIGVSNRFNVVFKGMEESATKTADALSASFGMATDDAQDMLTKFTMVLTNIGYTKEAAMGMSASMVALANDMASFNHVPVEQTLQALQSAMMGNTKGLREYGLAIDDATIKEKALELGLGSAKGELDATSKAYVIQQVLLQKSSDITGDYAKNQDNYNNTLKRFKGSMDDASQTIGAQFLPKISAILELFQELPSRFQAVLVAIPPLVAAFVALGGPLTIISIAIGGVTYAVAKYLKSQRELRQETEAYIDKVTNRTEAEGILARVLDKVTIAQDNTAKAKKNLNEAIAAGDNEQAIQFLQQKVDLVEQEEIKVKMLRNAINQKIDSLKQEEAQQQNAAAKMALSEAKAATSEAKKKEQAEQAAKDKIELDKKTAEAKIKREADIKQFISDAKIDLASQDQKELATLEKWYAEKLILVKGNEEAELLLKQDYDMKKAQVDKAAEDRKIASDERIAAKAKEAEDKKMAAYNGTAGVFAKSMTAMASKFKEFFILAKAANIAEATMAGYASAVQAFKWGTTVGGPILGGIMAGVSALATGIQIANIAATPPPFQTAAEQMRTVMGPSNRTQLATLHGNETVSRKGSGGITINVQGSLYNRDDTLAAIAEGLRYYTKQTGVIIQGA